MSKDLHCPEVSTSTSETTLTGAILDTNPVSSLLKLARDIDPGTQEIDPLSSKFLAHEISDTAQISLESLLSEQKHRRLAEEAGTKAQHLLVHLLSLLQILQKQLSSISDNDKEECIHPIRVDIEKLLNEIPAWLKDTSDEPREVDTSHPTVEHDNDLDKELDSKPKKPSSLPNESDEIRIKTFGGFEISFGDTTITDFKNAKGKQLLKYLLINRRRIVPKEELMELLWPNHDELSARNNLNVVVYSVRHTVRDYIGSLKFIVFNDGGYQINPRLRISADFEEFTALSAKGLHDLETDNIETAIPSLERAEKLYLGDFLSDDLYLDWTDAPREAYKDKYINILFSLDSSHKKLKNSNKRIEINKRILQIDGCNELAHQSLMEIYDQKCQRHLALKQYKQAQATLSRELGVEPCEQLESLYKQIGARSSCSN